MSDMLQPSVSNALNGTKEGISSISAIAYGFLGSQALFSALRLELFTLLAEQPLTLAELAGKLTKPIDPLQLRVLLTTCLSLNLLSWNGEHYQNSLAAQRYLVKTSRSYIGDYYLRQIQLTLYDSATQIQAILEGQVESSPTYARFLETPERAEEFIRGQHAGSSSPAYLLARSLDLAEFNTLLDLGGGSGAFSLAVVRHFPQLKAIVLDHPQVIAITNKIIQEEGLADRVTTATGNLLTDPWPQNADVILLSYIASCYRPQTLATLLAQAYAYLPAGGQIIIHDFAFYPDRSGPRNAAMLLFGQLAISAQTQAYTTTELSEAMETAGFSEVSVQPHLPDLTFLLRGHKKV